MKVTNKKFLVNLNSFSLHKKYLILILLIASSSFQKTTAQTWDKVPDIDISKLHPSDFSNTELDLPYYLKHFHTLANSVVETGPDKGFINIPVWRNPQDNKPYNARIMENVISLSYFYATKRPWNPYYNSPAVKLRIEAAIDFLCRIQNSNGAFSEYGKEAWNLAATAFATKFIGASLAILSKGPTIDKSCIQRLKTADRKAIMFVLNDEAFFEWGKQFTNQYTNAWAGAFAYMSMYPDQEMHQKLTIRMKQSVTDFQSPAGYFYEGFGADYSYNFHTQHSNLWMSYNYCRGTDLGQIIIDEENKFAKWISYNATKEPGSNVYTLNREIEIRQSASVVGSYFVHTPLSKEAAGVRAYNLTAEELNVELQGQRKSLENEWPTVPELKTGTFSAYTPYTFLHRDHYSWNPTAAQKQAAIADLPYLKSNRFIHQMRDNNQDFVYTYVRRPGYYAAFNSGKILQKRNRFGLGLLWSPVGGSFLQSQTDSDSAAWGTISEKGKLYESNSLHPIFKINEKTINPEIGSSDLEEGKLYISYPLGTIGNKSLTFGDSQIDVSVDCAGDFTECLPLLKNKSDQIEFVNQGKLKLTKGGTDIVITFSGLTNASLKETAIRSGDQQVVVLYLKAHDRLSYSIISR